MVIKQNNHFFSLDKMDKFRQLILAYVSILYNINAFSNCYFFQDQTIFGTYTDYFFSSLDLNSGN